MHWIGNLSVSLLFHSLLGCVLQRGRGVTHLQEKWWLQCLKTGLTCHWLQTKSQYVAALVSLEQCGAKEGPCMKKESLEKMTGQPPAGSEHAAAGHDAWAGNATGQPATSSCLHSRSLKSPCQNFCNADVRAHTQCLGPRCSAMLCAIKSLAQILLQHVTPPTTWPRSLTGSQPASLNVLHASPFCRLGVGPRLRGSAAHQPGFSSNRGTRAHLGSTAWDGSPGSASAPQRSPSPAERLAHIPSPPRFPTLRPAPPCPPGRPPPRPPAGRCCPPCRPGSPAGCCSR